LSPYLQLTQNILHTSPVHEKGNAAALNIEAGHDRYFSAILGLRGFYDLPTSTPVRLKGDFGWAHGFDHGVATSRHYFRHESQYFDIEGIHPERDRVFIGLGMSTLLSRTVALDVGYQGQFGHGLADHSANIELKFRF